MTDELMSEIKAPRTDGSIITVVGVGGAGGNAVNHMWNLGIRGVTFMVCNTDQQALDKSPVERKIRLGAEGARRGQRSRERAPRRGRDAARNPPAARGGRYEDDLHHGRHGRRHGYGRFARHRQTGPGDGTADGGHRHLATGRRGQDPLRAGVPRHRGAAAERRFAAHHQQREHSRDLRAPLAQAGLRQGRRHPGFGGEGHRRDHHRGERSGERRFRRRLEGDARQRPRPYGRGRGRRRQPRRGGGRGVAALAAAGPQPHFGGRRTSC